MFLQLDVTYQLRLRLYGSENHGAQVANESNSINITVLANNFPFGLFSFPHANYSVTVGTVLPYVLLKFRKLIYFKGIIKYYYRGSFYSHIKLCKNYMCDILQLLILVLT